LSTAEHLKPPRADRFWRWFLAHVSLVVLLTMALALGAEWYLTRNVEKALEARMTVDLTTGTSIFVQAIEIEALGDIVTGNSSDPNAIVAACGPDYGELLQTPTAGGGYLKHDVMELRVAERGTVCLTYGQTLSIGDVRIVASEIGKQVADPNSSGQLRDEQIEVFRVLAKRNIYLSLLLGTMTLIVGAALGIRLDLKARQYHPHDERSARTPS
jgi:hypothetical protein